MDKVPASPLPVRVLEWLAFTSRLKMLYKVLHRKTVGDAFFKELDDLVSKLCDDFEHTVRRPRE
ncbi:MAG: hypothetical protein VKN60_08230 [Cyanobacteriota bacterium]|nr:hypothetical protein [Cyanobacteriota bacterium]